MTTRCLFLPAALMSFLTFNIVLAQTATHLVISEVYGGGGFSASGYLNDYVELYNPTNSSVSLTGWSVQYASAAGTTWTSTSLNGTIPGKGFYLIKMSTSGSAGTVLPIPDLTNTGVNMSATAGKVVLANTTTVFNVANPSTAAVIDKLGYGSANGFETAAATGPSDNISSLERKASSTSTAISLGSGGSQASSGNGYDSGDNSADFVVQLSMNPQNAASGTEVLILAPFVSTTAATAIAATSCTSGGNVSADGGAAVAARGVVWNTSIAPTTALATKTSDGTGTGSFSSNLAGLSVNTRYFYRAYATNSAGTAYGAESSFYTLANSPGQPLLDGATVSELAILVDENGNPASTEFAIQETGSGNYVQASGALGIGTAWRTLAQWNALSSITGLSAASVYGFRVKARNDAGAETSFGATSSLATLAFTPGAPAVGNPTTFSLDLTVDANNNPSTATFAIQETGGNQYVQFDGTLASDASWRTAAAWSTITVTGLTEFTSYNFRVKARNPENVETAFGTDMGGTTLSASPPLLSASQLSAYGNVCLGSTGATQTFTITGTHLSSGNLIVSTLPGYSLSTDNFNYTDSLNIAQGGGSFSQLIYVKFVPTAAQFYAGNIVVSGGGASPVEVAVAGNGISPVTPALNIDGSDTAICAGSTILFIATPSSGGSDPTYEWQINGVTASGAEEASFSTDSLANNDTVSCVLSSSAGCVTSATAKSNALTIVVHPLVTPAVSLQASPSGIICPDIPVTITATPANGGNAPAYAWYKQGTLIDGVTGSSYTVGSPSNSDTITVMLTTNANCSTNSMVWSNSVCYQVLAVPASPASNPVFSAITASSIKLSFNRGSGNRGVIVFASEDAPVNFMPLCGNSYPAPLAASSTTLNVSFTAATLAQTGNARVIYRSLSGVPGVLRSLNLTSLKPNRRYFFAVYEFDSSAYGTVYLRGQPLLVDTMTALGPPTVTASNLRFENVTSDGFKVRWKNGNGQHRLVIVKEGSVVTAKPVDMNIYNASPAYAAGDSMDRPLNTAFTGTQYVVYTGNDSSATVTGLNSFTSYSIAVYEYNGSGSILDYSGVALMGATKTTGIALRPVGIRSMTISFAHNNGRGAIVLVKEGSPVTTCPSDGNVYTSPLIRSASVPTISYTADSLSLVDGAKIVYRHPQGTPAVKTLILTNLKSETHYYVAVYEWDSTGNLYQPATVLIADTQTLLGPPSILASALRFEDVTANSFRIRWRNGNGTRRLVVVKANSGLNAGPKDNTVYAADSDFAIGDTLTPANGSVNSGRNYVVFSGMDSTVEVTGLHGGVPYYVRVFEYNGSINPDYGNPSAQVAKRTLYDYIPLTTAGLSYSQNFESFDTISALPTGWHISTTTLGDNVITAGLECNTADGIYDYSFLNNHALGSMGANRFGIRLRNSTGRTITSLLVRYTGYQLYRGGSGSIDRLRLQFSTNAYTFSGAQQYHSNNAVSWMDATEHTVGNNTDIDFFSTDTTPEAACPGVIPTSRRGASITGLNLLPGQYIWLRFNDADLQGGDDALAIDDLEIIPFSTTKSGGESISATKLNDLNIVGGMATLTSASLIITYGLNIESGSFNFAGNSTHSLTIGGNLYNDYGSGPGLLACGKLSTLILAGRQREQPLIFDPTANHIRNLVLRGGVTASLQNPLLVTGGTAAGTVTIGTSAENAALQTNGFLTLQSDSLGTAAINPIYGQLNGGVTLERSMRYKAGPRLLAHPFNTSIEIAQLTDDISLDFSGGAGQNAWYYDLLSGGTNSLSSVLSGSPWTSFGSAADSWTSHGVVQLAKTAGIVNLDLQGELNQGVQVTTVSGNAGALVPVGNPYPSTVKMQNVLSNTEGIGDTVWTLNPVTGGWTAVPAVGWGTLSLPVCGVMLVRLTASPVSFIFNETDKGIAVSSASYFRDGDTAEPMIAEAGRPVLELAPNPATDRVTVRLRPKPNGSAIVQVLSVTGQLMLQAELQPGQYAVELTLNGLPPGVYVVEATVNGQTEISRLVKQ